MRIIPIYIMMSLMTVVPGTVQGQSKGQEGCLIVPHKTLCKTESLNLYVGPQSVEPGEDIFIAVETLTAANDSSQASSVVIIDELTGQRYEAPVVQGLAYIELKAPNQAGRLTFRAETDNVTSQPAEVLVHAGQAASFDIHIEKNKGQAFVWTSIITDKFGNFVDDGITATIELVSDDTVYASLQTSTQDGRIGLHIPCGEIKKTQSRIRARIGYAVQEMDIPTYLCGGEI